MNVFISSTCYDLIDLRAELQEKIRDLGLVPVMSDESVSDFIIDPSIDSIDNCLKNVARCEVFILVLSKRYGPSLKNVKHVDVSATHLEYDEAKKQKKKIYIYIRDKLDAAYDHWKRNGKAYVNNSWILREDEKILNFLDDLKKIRKGPHNNYCTVFSDSTEVKRSLDVQLKYVSKVEILKKLISSGNAPILILEGQTSAFTPNTSEINMNFIVKNYGKSTALNVELMFDWLGGNTSLVCGNIEPGQFVKHAFKEKFNSTVFQHNNTIVTVKSKYVTPEGIEIEDVTEVTLFNDKKMPQRIRPHSKFTAKKIVSSEGYKIL